MLRRSLLWSTLSLPFVGIVVILLALMAISCSHPPQPPPRTVAVRAPAPEPWPIAQDEVIYIPPEPPTCYFQYDCDEVDDVPYGELHAWADGLPRDIRVAVIGHADTRGSDEYNFGLGLKRARNVARVLMSSGIDVERLTVESQGESAPRVGETQEESYDLSRRVEILYVY